MKIQRGRVHGRRDDSIDCDSGIRGRLRAAPMGYEARRQVEERTGQTLQLKPVNPARDSLVGQNHRMTVADPCSPAFARNVCC